MTDRLERRDFLKRCLCTAVGGASFASTLTHWNTALAALVTDGAAFSEYRALVCVFLSGGNDSFNMVVPRSSNEYSVYAASRQNLAVAQNSLLPITTATAQPNGAQFGFHPSCTGMQSLFGQGRLAVVANVGVLLAPTTRTQYQARSVPLPPQLFSHADQSTQWLTAHADSTEKTGWAGRTSDLFEAAMVDPNALVSHNISLSGTNVLQTGASSVPFNMTRGGVPTLRGLRTTNAREARRLQAFQDLLNQGYSQPFMAEFARVQSSAMANAETINTALSNLAPFTTTFPGTRVGQDLQRVAQMIAIRSTLQATRQVFFVQMGGYDTHGEQLNRQPNLLADLDAALLAFYQATVELGLQDNVTTFTNSEFGRTLTSNGDGSDHGWGGNSLVLGGSVGGGDIYGTMPSLEIDGPDDTRNGRLIPSQAVDQYAATLARWWGLTAAQVPTVFPNIGRFATADLGFML